MILGILLAARWSAPKSGQQQWINNLMITLETRKGGSHWLQYIPDCFTICNCLLERGWAQESNGISIKNRCTTYRAKTENNNVDLNNQSNIFPRNAVTNSTLWSNIMGKQVKPEQSHCHVFIGLQSCRIEFIIYWTKTTNKVFQMWPPVAFLATTNR